MDLQGKHIAFLCQYAAPYEGNFLLSLKKMELVLGERYAAQCAYVFPMQASQQSWFDDFNSAHTVFLTSDSMEMADGEIQRMFAKFCPDIVYTHFDGYDMPVARVVQNMRRSVKQVWHMHNTLGFHPNPIKSLYQIFCFFRHYGLPFLRGGEFHS